MPIDRPAALRNAEKLLRQGKLELAIAEYSRIVDEEPRDWNTANLLGDLYLRNGDVGRAVGQFIRIADSLNEEGFLSKAGALYKKILKIKPDDEHALLQAAEIAGSQGLLVDARAYLKAVLEQRRGRGDARGVAEVRIRFGSLDPDDYEARLDAARAQIDVGNAPAAVHAFKAIAADLAQQGRQAASVDALRQAASIDADDPHLLLALVGANLRGGRVADGLSLARRFLAGDSARRQDLVSLGCAVGEQMPDAGFDVIEVVVTAAVAQSEWSTAAAALEEFTGCLPHYIPALMRLIEVAVDAGSDEGVCRAQGQLADAYLGAGAGREARVIVEDLIAHEPENPVHVERLRRVLALLGEPDPDVVVARLVARADRPFNDELSPESAQSESHANAVNAERMLGERDTTEPLHAGSERAEVDLSIVLDDLRTAADRPSQPPADLDAVFAQLRDEAVRQSVLDPADEEYQRGLTLHRAGRIDECIAPLSAAARAPRLRFVTASLLARIYAERRQTLQAIEWFERAAEAPAPTPDEGQRLLYDLASALESFGEAARALAILMELRADAGNYRDVAERIERLTKDQARG